MRWILHAACAATFTLAMSLLAVRLRRPVMRTIATVWWWQLAIALHLVSCFYWRSWFVLSTVQDFARANGGDAFVESREGVGTRVTVRMAVASRA